MMSELKRKQTASKEAGNKSHEEKSNINKDSRRSPLLGDGPAVQGQGPPRSGGPAVQGQGPPRSDRPAVQGQGPPRSDRPTVQGQGPPRSDGPAVQGQGPPRSGGQAVQGQGPPHSDGPAVQGQGPPRSDGPAVQGQGPPHSDRPAVQGQGPPRSDRPVVQSQGPPRSGGQTVQGQGPPRSDGQTVQGQGPPRSDRPAVQSPGPPHSDGQAVQSQGPPRSGEQAVQGQGSPRSGGPAVQSPGPPHSDGQAVQSQGPPRSGGPAVQGQGHPRSDGQTVQGQGPPRARDRPASTVHGQGSSRAGDRPASAVHGQGPPRARDRPASAVHGQGSPRARDRPASAVHGQGSSRAGDRPASAVHGQGPPRAGDRPASTVQGQGIGAKSKKNWSHQAAGRTRGKGRPQSKTTESEHANRRPQSGKKKSSDNQHKGLSVQEIEGGFKSGRFIQGELRINPRDYKHAYITHPNGGSDVMIEGLEHRKPALSGDLVAVEILPEVQKVEPKTFHKKWELEKPEKKKEPEKKIEPITCDKGKEQSDRVEQLELLCASLGIETDVGTATQGDTPDVIIEEDRTTLLDAPKEQSGGAQQGTNSAQQDINSAQQDINSAQQDINSAQQGTNSAQQGTNSVPRKKVHRMGKVVSVLQRKHNRICSGHIKPMRTGDGVLFSPTDNRVPRILLSPQSCPPDFLKRPNDYVSVLFAAKILDWLPGSVFANGEIIHEIGQDGQMDTMIEGILLENDIDDTEFSSEVLNSITVLKVPKQEFTKRRDIRSECVFSIDPATARDLDDALSIEELSDGTFNVGVHIADVSYYLNEGTPLDDVASKRATSVYLTHKVIPMLPRILCEELCSLNPDVDRLTFSVVWNISAEGEIYSEWFGRTVIRSCVKLSYDHAQGFIEHPLREWTAEELPPISSNFTVEEIKKKVLDLNKIAVNLRKMRMEGGALTLNQVKLGFTLDDETHMPNGIRIYNQEDSNRLVEEFMLLANMAVAHKINQCLPETALLRRHPDPNADTATDIENLTKNLGVPLDFTSSRTLQKTLGDCREVESGAEKLQVLVAMCSKPMQMALYFCNGSVDDEQLYRHYALNIPLYTHFTSPIRRYADVLVHRALASALGYSQFTMKGKVIQHIADGCNDRKKAAKTVSDMSAEFFFAAYVKQVGQLDEVAMVMSVLDHCVDVYFLKLGLSKRVYIDKLPLKMSRYVDGKTLVLVWKKMDGMAGDTTQTLSIFTKVNCSITEGNYPLSWMATLKRPEDELVAVE